MATLTSTSHSLKKGNAARCVARAVLELVTKCVERIHRYVAVAAHELVSLEQRFHFITPQRHWILLLLIDTTVGLQKTPITDLRGHGTGTAYKEQGLRAHQIGLCGYQYVISTNKAVHLNSVTRDVESVRLSRTNRLSEKPLSESRG